MKRILIFSLWLATTLTLFADNSELISNYGGVYNIYTHGQLTDTKAPKGYTPFYISHMGRHGARYAVNNKYILRTKGLLEEAQRQNLLTQQGQLLLQYYQQLWDFSDGMVTQLCRHGAAEHRQIAERMAKRFDKVFEQPKRRHICVRTTHEPRCITSACNFIGALATNTRNLDFETLSGWRYTNLFRDEEHDSIYQHNALGGQMADEYMEKHFPYDSFYRRVFTDVEKGLKVMKSKRLLPENVYTNGTIAHYLGQDNLLNFLTPEEYKLNAITYNNKMYFQFCNSQEAGFWRLHYADALVRHFIDRADEAIRGNDVAADLRFSHDTGLMPFLSLIGVEGYFKSVTYDQAWNVWNSSKMMCMATNVQFIFYRGKANAPILVKILLNEEETSLPALTCYAEGNHQPRNGYYRWEEVKAYWLSRLKPSKP